MVGRIESDKTAAVGYSFTLPSSSLGQASPREPTVALAEIGSKNLGRITARFGYKTPGRWRYNGRN